MSEPRTALSDEERQFIADTKQTAYGGYMTHREAGEALRRCIGLINRLVIEAAGRRAVEAQAIAPYRAALEATREMVATADDRLDKRGDGIAAHIYMVNALDAIDALLADPPQGPPVLPPPDLDLIDHLQEGEDKDVPQGTWRDVASAEFAEELARYMHDLAVACEDHDPDNEDMFVHQDDARAIQRKLVEGRSNG